MKPSKTLWILLPLAAIILSLAFTDTGGTKKPPATALDEGEEQHLIFMREEEKLARDVYIVLGEAYPDFPVFTTIDDSEQRHFDTMKTKLDQYGIEDPNTDDRVGFFTGEEYGEYFTVKFEELTERGATGALEALMVGAFIEELDMHDIVQCPDAIVESDNGVEEGECGLDHTDERALEKSYENLLEGSKNHLRAFVKNIEGITGEDYQAQVLTQEEVDEILGRL